jgi:transposase-like protein
MSISPENTIESCPKCQSDQRIKAGIIQDRQRYRCKACGYHYTVQKDGKKIDDYYVTKAIQLYVEGVSYREIERLLGISHVSVMNWVRAYKIKKPAKTQYHPTYKIVTYAELNKMISNRENLVGAGMVITEVGDKYMVIRWERFRER